MTVRAFPVLAGVAAMAIMAACGAGDRADVNDSSGTPVGGLPTSIPLGTSDPVDVEGDLIIYHTTLEADAIASTLDYGRKFSFDFDPNVESVLGVDCTTDGARAAYLLLDNTSLDNRAVVADASGSREFQLSGAVKGVAISPDGSQLAFTAYLPANERGVLSFLDVETGQVTASYDRSGTIGGPRWSPDGSKVIFDAPEGGKNQLFVHTIGESGAAQITSTPQGAFRPDWSPGGATIVFSSYTPDGSPQLFTVPATGGEPAQLTSTRPFKASPRWSTDGSQIAYVGTVIVPTASRLPVRLHNVAVYISASDGTDEVQFTDLGLDAWLLAWCKAGPWLLQGWTQQ